MNVSSLRLCFPSPYKVGDTARELALQNGFKAIAKLLGPTKGDTRRVSNIVQVNIHRVKRVFKWEQGMFTLRPLVATVNYFLKKFIKIENANNKGDVLMRFEGNIVILFQRVEIRDTYNLDCNKSNMHFRSLKNL